MVWEPSLAQEKSAVFLLSRRLESCSKVRVPSKPNHIATRANLSYQVPVNLKDKDAFHITIEEYILALTELTEELSRLSMNSVTMGDIDLTVRISSFIKDLFAGFQLLNLKNDIVRKRVDAVKYHVKKVEDVIYDLTLRNLIPKSETSS